MDLWVYFVYYVFVAKVNRRLSSYRDEKKKVAWLFKNLFDFLFPLLRNQCSFSEDSSIHFTKTVIKSLYLIQKLQCPCHCQSSDKLERINEIFKLEPTFRNFWTLWISSPIPEASLIQTNIVRYFKGLMWSYY